MKRPPTWKLLAVLWGVLVLAACTQSRQAERPKPQSEPSSVIDSTDALRYGPVYSVRAVKDPVVAKTLKGAETTGTPVISAEIRGFLVDWVIKESSDSASIRELAVMKDGSVYNIGMMRPSAAFGVKAPARLTPESAQEARARKASLLAAQKAVSKIDPKFAKVKPIVYNYLVRFNRKDGSSVDVWVDPDVGEGRFFYGIELRSMITTSESP